MMTMLALLMAAQPAPPAAMQMTECPATPAPPPAGMEGWARARPAQAGGSAAQATPLPMDIGVTAELMPTSAIGYAVPPEKPGGSISSGGIFAFIVPSAGRYRVALGSGAWIDVLRGSAPVAAAAHGHGPACSSIRKMVDFDLQPGRHLLQIAGAVTSTLPLMVSRLR